MKKLIAEDNTMTFFSNSAPDDFTSFGATRVEQTARAEAVHQTQHVKPRAAHSMLRRSVFAVLASLIVPSILCGSSLAAQADTLQAKGAAKQQTADDQSGQPRRGADSQTQAASTQFRSAPESIAARSSALPAPSWPSNEIADLPANGAKVSWDGHRLKIEASNSSLNQILHQVAAVTGATLQGLTQDQRIFGSYGPGPGCSVLSKLLEGSGYNVLIVGSRDADVPLEIILTPRSPGIAQTNTSNLNRGNSVDDHVSQQPPPEPQPAYSGQPAGSQPIQNPFANGAPPPHDPLQFMQEILQRQQVIDQQQEQKQKDQQNLQH